MTDMNHDLVVLYLRKHVHPQYITSFGSISNIISFTYTFRTVAASAARCIVYGESETYALFSRRLGLP